MQFNEKEVSSVAKEARIRVTPTACICHDREKYTIEVELAGVEKKNIDFQISERSFCLSAPRRDIEYHGCWVFAHKVHPAKAKAAFRNGLLTVTAPLAESFKGLKLPIE